MVSNGILIDMFRGITIQDTDLRQAQYQGGGGYGYVLMGNDNLIQDCYGEELRYVYDFKLMRSNGNVIYRSVSNGISDFHIARLI